MIPYKLLAYGGICLALVLAYLGWHHHVDKQGYDRATKEWKYKIEQANLKAAETLKLRNDEIAVKQEVINQVRQQIIDKNTELLNVKLERDRIAADYRSGVKRMSVPAVCKSDRTEPNSSAGLTAKPSENRCELLPETSGTIFDIARRYNEDVHKLNECIELYNSVKNTVNSKGN